MKFPSIWVLLLLLPVVEALQEESVDRILGAIIPPPIWCIINGCCCRFIKWFSVDCGSIGVWKSEPIGTGVGIVAGDPNPPAHCLPRLPTGDGKGGVRAVCKGEMLIPGSPAHPVFIVRLLWTGHIPALVPYRSAKIPYQHCYCITHKISAGRERQLNIYIYICILYMTEHIKKCCNHFPSEFQLHTL